MVMVETEVGVGVEGHIVAAAAAAAAGNVTVIMR
jgi:hypothetical protein